MNSSFDLSNIHLRLPGEATFSVAQITANDRTTHEVAVISRLGDFIPVSEWHDDDRDKGDDVMFIAGTADALAGALEKAIDWSQKAVSA